MASSKKCKQGRNKSRVVVDVSGKQEYLRYRVCITSGARNDGIIVDKTEKIILDESYETSRKCRQREWPAEGTSVPTGKHVHTLVLVFVRAVEYTYQVTLHNEDGSIKAWVKNCTYKRKSQTDHRAVNLSISVK